MANNQALSDQQIERQILATSTFSVLNRRSLLLGVEVNQFYGILFSGIPCWQKTNSFLVTVLYLAAVLFAAWALTRKDPDRIQYLWHYLRASTHYDAGQRRHFTLRIVNG